MTNERTNGNISTHLDNLQAYPLLTTADSAVPATPSAPAGGAGGIGKVVESNLREVLAWRPRATDPKGFLAALNQAFSIRDVEGHTEWSWTPRSYAVQADMGAVTGAQASIFARAKAALDQSLPLLEGLYPLRSDADIQNIEAVRALVRNALTELVEELGQVGGPRLQRVHSYFLSLLGRIEPPPADGERDNAQAPLDPEHVGGLLGMMRERFGLERRQVNTIDEEQNLTNYLILVDHTIALQRSCMTYQHFFNRVGDDVFLGTQLVLLSRALGVIAESVNEVAAAMDSVYLDAAERQITRLPFKRHQFRLTIAELLDWAYSVSADEGPRLVTDAGKDGVITLYPTLKQLHGLVVEMLEISLAQSQLLQNDRLALVPAFSTPRVQKVLDGLERSLAEAVRLTQQVKREPETSVTAISPTHAMTDDVVRISIEGTTLPQDARVHLNRSGPSNERIPGQNFKLISPNEIRATFDLHGRDPGSWTMVVVGPDGSAYTLKDAFTIEDRPRQALAAPAIGRLDPAQGLRGERLEVNITGGNFDRDAKCDFGPGIAVLGPPVFLGPTHLQVRLRIAGDAAFDLRAVRVTNPDGRSGEKQDGFQVVPSLGAEPKLRSVEPNEIRTTDTNPIAVQIKGAHIQDGATITFADIEVLDFRRISKRWFAFIEIPPNAAAGSRDVTLTNPDGSEASIAGGFSLVDPLQGDSDPDVPAERALTISAMSFLNGPKRKSDIAPDAFENDHSFGLNHDGVDAIEIVFSRNLKSDADPTKGMRVEDANGQEVAVTPSITDTTVRLDHIEAQEIANFPPGVYHVRTLNRAADLVDGPGLADDMSVTFTIVNDDRPIRRRK